MATYAFVLIVGLLAGTLSGIIGTGASIMLLPVLVYEFGPQQAVPIMAVAGLLLNIGKMLAWWREVDWRAFLAYAIGGVPAAALGARTLLVLPARLADVILGAFFLAIIPVRRQLKRRHIRLELWQLAAAGAVIGFITGIVISTGPLSVPAFLAYGVTKGAFLSTEAASSLALMLSKVVTFREFGALPLPAIVQGLVIGGSAMAGTFLGKAVVLHLSAAGFEYLLDGMLASAGLALLWSAVQ
jgi:uncharacterized membrane protein YfcA